MLYINIILSIYIVLSIYIIYLYYLFILSIYIIYTMSLLKNMIQSKKALYEIPHNLLPLKMRDKEAVELKQVSRIEVK